MLVHLIILKNKFIQVIFNLKNKKCRRGMRGILKLWAGYCGGVIERYTISLLKMSKSVTLFES